MSRKDIKIIMEKILIIIPAYNEEANILKAFNKIKKFNKFQEFHIFHPYIRVKGGNQLCIERLK